MTVRHYLNLHLYSFFPGTCIEEGNQGTPALSAAERQLWLEFSDVQIVLKFAGH